MKIVDFISKTIDGALTLEDQKKYLMQKPFGTPAELAEAVFYLKDRMPPVPDIKGAIDVCGTGGSGLDRINTSTISAFLLAACDVPVAKHGNNASSGRFGSFDLLMALDVPCNLSAQELQLRFKEYNLAFLYAKSFHPVLRHFADIRTSLAKPTFFNILGPLLSPVDAKRQIIGTPRPEYGRIICEVAKLLGKERVMAVSGSDGLDEVTLSGPTHIVELKYGKIKEYDISPADFGVPEVSDFSEISGQPGKENLRIALDILSQEDKTRRTDLVLVNSALALFLVDKCKDLMSGYDLAKKILMTGKAYETLCNYRRPSILNQIASNDPRRNFETGAAYDIEIDHQIIEYKGGLIAEIKERSPSEGVLREKVNYSDMAKIYTRAGASAISVLTETEKFGGSFYKLSRARKGTYLPLLCKDFILRTEHIDKAKAAGADMILLIVAMLDDEMLAKLYKHAAKLSLQILIEVHNQEELIRALRLNPKIIGINSRNLHDFSINKNLFNKLSAEIPAGIIKIAESGLKKFKDLPEGYDGALVGSEIMKHPFPKLKIKELTGKPLLKLCGIRSVEQAALCEILGVDMIGINFVPRSTRKVSARLAEEISLRCTSTITVGVFENQSPEEVNKLALKARLDAVQLCGHERNLSDYELPVIKTINLGADQPTKAFMTILDGKLPGSGQLFDHGGLSMYEPSLIAGGITLQTARDLASNLRPLGFDVASGIETDGKVDSGKIKAFAKQFA